MSLSSIKVWARDATEQLEDQAPTKSKAIAETAIRLLGEVIEKLEAANQEVMKARKELMAARLGGELSKIVDDAMAKRTGASGVRWPKIWRDDGDWPDLDGVEKVQDNSGDTYEYDKASQKWALLGHDGRRTGSLYTMERLVDDYQPVIEVGSGVRKIRWFLDDLDGNKKFELPEHDGDPVMFIEDGDGEMWGRPYRSYNLWSYEGWDHDDRKDAGYDTLYEVIEDTGSATIVLRSDMALSPLHFKAGEDEPHETVKQVHNPTSNWFYRNDGNGNWVAPGVEHRMRDVHGSDTVKWDELLKHAGELREHLA